MTVLPLTPQPVGAAPCHARPEAVGHAGHFLRHPNARIWQVGLPLRCDCAMMCAALGPARCGGSARPVCSRGWGFASGPGPGLQRVPVRPAAAPVPSCPAQSRTSSQPRASLCRGDFPAHLPPPARPPRRCWAPWAAFHGRAGPRSGRVRDCQSRLAFRLLAISTYLLKIIFGK